MKAEINNENKAKFFALYFGQYIGRNPLSGENKIYVSEHFLNVSGIGRAGYLYLKPLSQISDEDLEKLNIRNDFVKRELFGDPALIEAMIHLFKDELRSMGYALPWIGLSIEEMIEAGWIKLIES